MLVCPNWLVTSDGIWSGVIDFEFSYWGVRVADFTRYPDWDWMVRPDLVEAFFDGYGRSFTPQEEQQCLVAYAQYALNAIVWGGRTPTMHSRKRESEHLSALASYWASLRYSHVTFVLPLSRCAVKA